MVHRARLVVRLALRDVTAHPVRSVFTALSVGLATALVAAVLSLSTSLTGSVASAGTLAGRADLEVAAVSASGFGEDLLDVVEELPGVRAAVPVVRARVRVGGEEALLLGVDGRVRALGGEVGEAVRRRARELAEDPFRLLDEVGLAAPLAAAWQRAVVTFGWGDGAAPRSASRPSRPTTHGSSTSAVAQAAPRTNGSFGGATSHAGGQGTPDETSSIVRSGSSSSRISRP